MATDQHPRGRDGGPGPRRAESWAGWVRRDTSGVPEATYRAKENAMILKARSRARVILASSIESLDPFALIKLPSWVEQFAPDMSQQPMGKR